MLRHRLVLLVLSAALVAACIPVASAAARKPPVCEKTGGTTLFQSPQWRVFKTVAKQKGHPDVQIERVWSCVPGHRVLRGLATFHNDLDLVTDARGATVNGRWIALDLDFVGGASETFGIKEYDLQTGRFEAQLDFGEDAAEYVITGTGALAYIGNAAGANAGGSLIAFDGTGKHVLVAADDAMEVAASGRYVYWTSEPDGTVHGALLAGHAKGRFDVSQG